MTVPVWALSGTALASRVPNYTLSWYKAPPLRALLINPLDDATCGPAAPRTIVNVALRAVGIGFLVDDERTPILIKDAERARRQGDPSGERQQDAVPPLHADVDQIAGVEGVVGVNGGVAIRAGIEVPSGRGAGSAVGRLMHVHAVLTVG